VEKYCRSGQTTDDNMAHRFACRITKATDTHSEYVNTYCFFTATVGTGTLLRLTFIGMAVLLLTWGVYGGGFFKKLQ
jgi:hypothetical protein